ncbi:IclR family transcriptional regulator domain-containing protein [Glutamicibacter protophormiae]|uniref:IclR family transcriptional regulator domain-containing protein n=1 Tax=Glutamicibacter protophormiae TaxID=37930 RepID=UPI003A94C302
MRRDSNPDFIESIARGLDVIRSFDAAHPAMTLSEVANRSELPRPTARRILTTLELLGYAHRVQDAFMLTPRVLELGTAYIGSMNIWQIVRPNLVELVAQTHESCSIAQLDGSDIVYVARVAVPKLVTLSVTIGTRFPALATSLGKVLLASLEPTELDEVLATPSRSGVSPRWQPDRRELDSVLRGVRERGWAVTDEQLALGIRSVATAVTDGTGRTVAAVNVNASSAETSLETLVDHHLPLLREAAAAIGRDWAAWHARPFLTTPI